MVHCYERLDFARGPWSFASWKVFARMWSGCLLFFNQFLNSFNHKKFQWTPVILFKLLVMTWKHFCLLSFLLLNISDFSLFFKQKLQPLSENVHPLFPSKCPWKIETQSSHPFWKFGRRFNPHPQTIILLARFCGTLFSHDSRRVLSYDKAWILVSY